MSWKRYPTIEASGEWFMGPVKTVYGRSGTFAHDIETDDLSIAFLTFENGAWGSIVTTTASYPSLGSLIEITEDNGSLVWRDLAIQV